MRVIPLSKIQPILANKPAVIAAVTQAFIDHSQGKITMPSPVQMLFGESGGRIAGDCHIKTASSESLPFFCIKVATGFYDNPAKGLPVNSGLVMLMCAETGQPLTLFQDGGYMTSARTAAAGAIAASLSETGTPRPLGIIGTGHQAELQARWISSHCDISSLFIWGRSREKALALQNVLGDLKQDVQICDEVSDVCDRVELIVTTTPSTSPLVMANHIKPGHHIIAIGADSPGKTEVAPSVLAKADIIMTDDRAQCLAHGEFGYAVRASCVAADASIDIGTALEAKAELGVNEITISVTDLTGLGAQDLALAAMVYDRLLA